MSNMPTTIGADSLSPEDTREKRAIVFGITLLSFLVAPFAVITVFLTYSLVGIKKQKPKVIYTGYAILAILLLISTLPFLSIDWIVNLFSESFEQQSNGEINGVWGYLFILLKFYVYQIPLDLLIGGFIGCVYTAYRMFFRDKWEEVVFEPTPIQKLKEKKNITEIQNDENGPEEGRTLGIETYRRFPPQDKKKQINVGNNFHGEKVIQTPQEAAAHTLILGAAGSGKALEINTPIMTTKGFVKMGELTEKDYVIHPSFNPTHVDMALEIQKNKPSYKFKFSDGSHIISDKEHIWATNFGNITSAEIVNFMKEGTPINIQTAKKKPVEFKNTIKTEHDPFITGSLWHLNDYMIHGGLQGSYLAGEWLNRGYQLKVDPNNGIYSHNYTHIPKDFIRITNGNLEQRWELLKGVLYSGASIVSLDETYQKEIKFPVFSYEAKTHQHALDLIMLATSLGIHTVLEENTVLLESVSLNDTKFDCFDIRQGYSSLLAKLKETRHFITIISYEETIADVRCIKVNSQDGLFVAGESAIPTHNTTTLLLQSRDIIKQGEGFAFVDLKGGHDVAEALDAYCRRYGKTLHHWTLQDSYLPYEGPADNGPAYYDPITRGDPSRRKDLILALRKWDAAADVYKKASASYIQTLFNVISLSPNPKEESTLNDVINLMQSPQELMARLDLVPMERRNTTYNNTRQAVKIMMTSTNKITKESVKTTQETLQVFSQSIAGPWLGKDPNGKEDINLWDIANKGEVILFSLDSANYPELSQDIANLIIQDLKTVSSEFRKTPPKHRLNVFIDEFSAIESDNLIQLVNKCRDANIPVSFATQTLADMKTVSETFAEQLNGIISSFIIHRINSEIDAKEYSGIFGKEDKAKVMKEVEHSSGLFGGIGRGSATGKGRVSYEKDYIVPIEKLQEMPVGKAVYHTKATNKEGVSSRTYYITVIPEMFGDNKAVKEKDARTEEREKALEMTSFNQEKSVSWDSLPSVFEQDESETSVIKDKANISQKEESTMVNDEYGYDTDDYNMSDFGEQSRETIRYTGKTPDITKLVNISAISNVEKKKIKNFFQHKKNSEEFKENIRTQNSSSPDEDTSFSNDFPQPDNIWEADSSQTKKKLRSAPKQKEVSVEENQSKKKIEKSSQENKENEKKSPVTSNRPNIPKRPVRPSRGQTNSIKTEKEKNSTQPQRNPSINRPTLKNRPKPSLPKTNNGKLPPLKKKPIKKIEEDNEENKFSW